MTNLYERQRWLRNSLIANAVFSTVTGLAFAFAATSVAAFIGLEQSLWVRAIGVGLLGFAGYVAFVATRAEIDLRAAAAIVLGDLSWVVCTVPIVMLDLLSANGLVAAIAIADIVLLFAGLQYFGMRRIRGGAHASGTTAA